LQNSETIKTLILCGGKGTRAYPHTLDLPKPLLHIDGRPILAHIMQIYATQGFKRFVLSAGFKWELIDDFAAETPSDWEVEVVNTGEEALTGARIAKCRDHLGDTFFATYGDGVGDIDLSQLLRFHASHRRSATVTVVPLPSPYGVIEHDRDGRVAAMVEKPVLTEHWINAGFFVMSKSVFEHWQGEDLEREVLPALSAADELYAFRHEGFWRSMDTAKDAEALTKLSRSTLGKGEDDPPWLRSPTRALS
jgi:glucose-1-phosphate cytidylyltransferase